MRGDLLYPMRFRRWNHPAREAPATPADFPGVGWSLPGQPDWQKDDLAEWAAGESRAHWKLK